jgi:hypothetical protein
MTAKPPDDPKSTPKLTAVPELDPSTLKAKPKRVPVVGAKFPTRTPEEEANVTRMVKLVLHLAKQLELSAVLITEPVRLVDAWRAAGGPGYMAQGTMVGNSRLSWESFALDNWARDAGNELHYAQEDGEVNAAAAAANESNLEAKEADLGAAAELLAGVELGTTPAGARVSVGESLEDVLAGRIPLLKAYRRGLADGVTGAPCAINEVRSASDTWYGRGYSAGLAMGTAMLQDAAESLGITKAAYTRFNVKEMILKVK